MTDVPPGSSKPAGTGSNRDGTSCPPEDVLAAYADGALEEVARARIEDHLSRCEVCYFVIRETAETLSSLDEESPAARPAPRLYDVLGTKPRLVVAAMVATVTIAVISVMVWRHVHRTDSYQLAVQPLVEAVGERRLYEGRLTGGFRYGPAIGPLRARSSAVSPDLWKVYAAAEQLKRDHESDSRPGSERALAAAYLITGDVEQAIKMLEGFSREHPDDVQALSDLSAAYLTRARTNGAASDHVAALDAALRAVRLAPDMPEALFNKALALEALGQRAEARELWRNLAATLSGTGWGDEAARRAGPASRLRDDGRGESGSSVPSAQTAEPSPTERELIEGHLAYRWASAVLGGARSIDLDDAHALAGDVRRRSGDPFHVELLDGLSSARDDTRRSLAAGLAALQTAHRYAEVDRWKESYAEAADAYRLLKHAQSPARWLAANRMGNALYYLDRLPEADSVLGSVVGDCPARFLTPRARALWLLGLVRFVQERPFEAAQAHEQARRLYESLGEPEHVLFLRALIAQDLFALGRHESGWNEWVAVMRSLDEIALSPRREYTVIWEGARRLIETRPAVSLHLLNRAVEVARSANDGALLAAALIRRGRAALRCGALSLARSDADEARSLLADMSTDLRATWQQDLEVLRLEVQGRHLATTASQLRVLAASMARTGNRFETLEVRTVTADHLAQHGRRREAIQEIEEILRTMLDAASPIQDDYDAALFSRRIMDLKLELAVLYLAERQPEAALLTLLDVADVWRDAAAMELAALQRRLPDDTAVVVLMRARTEVFRWAVSRDGVVFGTHAIAGHVEDDLTAGVAGAGTRNAVIQALRSELRGRTGRLFVLPVGTLTGLDWGGVFGEAETVTDGALLILASGIRSVRRLPARTHGPVIGIGSPYAITVGSDQLPALPGVAKEMQLLGELYGPRFTQRHPDSARAFGRSAEGADLVHVAGHAVIDESDATRAALLIAPAVNRVFAMYASDVARLAWQRPPRIVVLNVCRGASPISGTTFSLARWFAAAGAALVVGPTEMLDDGDGYWFAAEFHRRIARGDDSLLAARGTRQSCRAESRSCRSFAAIADTELLQ